MLFGSKDAIIIIQIAFWTIFSGLLQEEFGDPSYDLKFEDKADSGTRVSEIGIQGAPI
jgi:hypothetical protein